MVVWFDEPGREEDEDEDEEEEGGGGGAAPRAPWQRLESGQPARRLKVAAAATGAPENSRSSSVPVAWKTSSSTTTTTPIPNQNVMSKLWILLALVAAAVALPAQPDRVRIRC